MIVDIFEQRDASAYAEDQTELDEAARTLLLAIVGSYAATVVIIFIAAVLS